MVQVSKIWLSYLFGIHQKFWLSAINCANSCNYIIFTIHYLLFATHPSLKGPEVRPVRAPIMCDIVCKLTILGPVNWVLLAWCACYDRKWSLGHHQTSLKKQKVPNRKVNFYKQIEHQEIHSTHNLLFLTYNSLFHSYMPVIDVVHPLVLSHAWPFRSCPRGHTEESRSYYFMESKLWDMGLYGNIHTYNQCCPLLPSKIYGLTFRNWCKTKGGFRGMT